MSEILISSVWTIWQKRKIHNNTDFAVTGWMLYVIRHIHKGPKDYSDSGERKKVKNVIKTLFHWVPKDEMVVTRDILHTEYTEFNNTISSMDADEFIWKNEKIRKGNSHLWHQKYSPPCTKVLCFVAFRVISKVLGIDAAERSWVWHKDN